MAGFCLCDYFPWLIALASLAYALVVKYSAAQDSSSDQEPHVNRSVRKDQDKVVDTIEIEELGNQQVFCRCWKSKKFPYCDGTHNSHNKATGDNVGPVIVKKKAT